MENKNSNLSSMDALTQLLQNTSVRSATEIDINKVGRLAELENKRNTFDTVLSTFRKNQRIDRFLKRKYALMILRALGLEIFLGIASFVSIGIGWFHVSPWVSDVFFVSIFGQTITAFMYVVKNLFPPVTKDNSSQIKEIVESLYKDPYS